MTELKRIFGYMRPYLGQMMAAAVMLAIAGAMMTLVVATLEPMVNDLLLSRPAQEATPTEDEDPEFLDRLVERLPIEATKMWLSERPMVKVPVLLVLVFLVRGILLYFGEIFAQTSTTRWSIRRRASSAPTRRAKSCRVCSTMFTSSR
ncbi:MAG: hypothetical protein IFK92_04570 [Acidobacteria bacterium]|nr:hypothetical protein [Candidatus Sulfomarinibacter kjeldsenii]